MSGGRSIAKRNKTGPSFAVRFDCVSDVDIEGVFLFIWTGLSVLNVLTGG